jgi:sulfatase maturation enzyme AslB (radical SAM superfamily)
MDTFCSRSWNNYFIDLEFLTYKMCCRTSLKPMKLGEDWFNSPELQERRADHLSGKQHKSCNYCWTIENKGLKSFRKDVGGTRPNTLETVKDFYSKQITIKVGNICNMACRYCGPQHSSIWAERLHNTTFNKKGALANKSDVDRQQILEQLYNWLDTEIKFCNEVVLTGGEPSISPQFYDLVDRMNFSNLKITINTNLNAPPMYLKEFENALNKLSVNNKVVVRISLDGVDNQNNWQRQGGNWEYIKSNYMMLSKIPVYLMIAQTVTPLTLEGMPKIAEFIASTSDKFIHRPKFDTRAHIVTYPSALNPLEWIASYKDELREFIKIVVDNKLERHELVTQINDWLNVDDTLPSKEAVTLMINWLDKSQKDYGGGDWRSIYPKTAKIATQILNDMQVG